jgi:hypothetical protein
MNKLVKNRAKSIRVNDLMQSGYAYTLTEPMGKNFDPDFNPELTPKQMLSLGIFGGKYMNDCRKEFPADWFTKAKLSPDEHDPLINYFKVDASQSLNEWKRKGWINEEHDPRGWFQWYCRYFLGRRLPEYDQIQIKRWRAMRRHIGQIKQNCLIQDLSCRPRQRQALIHWAYDSRQI